ncbi:MAG TPA: BtuF-related (seleno)protein [Gemmatimonadales bacterium]|nr:BtuF-related (seleno)protein [Gemmatimonadales bacterium]
MRVVSLLPAATEIVAALGEASLLVGISHECDFPPFIRHLPRVTTTPVDVRASGLEIDREVRRLCDAGTPVVVVDAAQLRRLAPDLILTQGLCEVCAIDDGQINQLADSLHPRPSVLSLRAQNLNGIWDDVRNVGSALGLDDEAEELILGLESRLARLRGLRLDPIKRVLCIEWLEPLYLAGHWVPELVAAAGGIDVGAAPGTPSSQREWEELSGLRPDHILVALCGFGLERTRAELELLTNPAALELMGRVPTWIIDGNAYTSRPGPRTVDGAARIASALRGLPLSGIEQWQPARVC